jgi:uncharacterized repeat protein (TIGR03803 family)
MTSYLRTLSEASRCARRVVKSERVAMRVLTVVSVIALSYARLHAQSAFDVLHAFSEPAEGGAFPGTALLEIQPGVFYGAADGLATLPGSTTLFAVDNQGSFAVLNALARKYGSGTEGIIEASDGNLYISNLLGSSPKSPSSILKSDLQGNATIFVDWTQLEGGGPFALVEAGDGLLYGVTLNGEGSPSSGIIFSLTLAGTLTVLHTFSLAEGSPDGPPVKASDGNFYGETSYGGGTYGAGTLYRMTPSGALTTLYSFTGAADGDLPSGGLIQAHDGYLYGVTSFGGNSSDGGTIFKSTVNGSLTTLHSFSGPDGMQPFAALVEATDGGIYGATSSGGTSESGTVFRVTPEGVFTVIDSFDGGVEGSNVQAPLVQGSDGSLYGVALQGGPFDYGTAFRLNLNLPKPPPAISFFEPESGASGSYVMLTGTNLIGPTTVLFNGTPANFVSRGGHYILAQAPVGATSGPISISTPNGTAVSRCTFLVK